MVRVFLLGLLFAATSCQADPARPQLKAPLCPESLITVDVPMDISYDNRSVVYAHAAGSGEYGVYIARTSSEEAPRFLMEMNPLANDPSGVRISPDGASLVISRGTNDIFLLDLASGCQRQITFTNGNASDPEWDPSGRFVVYQRPHRRYGDDQYGLFIVDIENLSESRLNHDGLPIVGADPRWSPNGDWIAFWGGVLTGEAVALHVQVISPDGALYRDLNPGTLLRNQFPIWVDGGDRVLFLQRANTSYEHWVLSASLENEETTEWPLDLARYRIPWVVSRDGSWFAFTAPDANCEYGVVYIQQTNDVTGLSARQVTRHGAESEVTMAESMLLLNAFDQRILHDD